MSRCGETWKDETVKRRERSVGELPDRCVALKSPRPITTHTLLHTLIQPPADWRATHCFPLKGNFQKTEGTLKCLTLFYCKANYRQRMCQRLRRQKTSFSQRKYIKDKEEAEECVEGRGEEWKQLL